MRHSERIQKTKRFRLVFLILSHIYPLWSILAVSTLLSSCAVGPKVHVSVNGYARGESVPVHGKRILVVINEKASNPILLEEVANKIRRAMKQRGLISVDKAGEADFLLDFEFGVDSGQTITSTEVSSSPGYQLNVFSGQFESVSTTSSSSSTHTIFTRHLLLRLSAMHDTAGSEKKSKAVWVGEIKSRGSNSDLRRVVDYLIAAGIEHIGENTGKEVKHRYLLDEDPIIHLSRSTQNQKALESTEASSGP